LAYLVASCLPDGPLRIFECDIGVAGSVEWVPEPSAQIHLTLFPGDYSATIGIPPHVRYQTKHRARTVILDAPDVDAAEEIARRRFLRCIASLAMVGNNPVAPAGLLGPMFAGEGTEQADPGHFQFVGGGVGMSLTQGFIPLQTLSDEARGGVFAIEGLAKDPEVAWLLERFAAAEGRHLLEFSQFDRAQLVIEYCRVLEKIGQLVAPHIKTKPGADLEAIRTKLIADLTRKKSPRQVAGLIKQAHQKAGRAMLAGSAQQIRAAGMAFGFGDAELQAAADAWTARSSRTGHPADDELTPTDLLNARASTRIYLGAFFGWLSEQALKALGKDI